MRYKYKAYVFDLPGATLIYRYTVLELVSRGYKFSEAKTLVRNSVFFAQGRIVKPSATSLKNRPHMVFGNQGIFVDADLVR